MSSSLLKLIGCISMFLDHLGYHITSNIDVLGYLGRIAFPIFAFQISEGYRHTKNKKKYFIRLFLLALISQYPFFLVFQEEGIYLNVVFTLLFGFLGIYLYEKRKRLGFIYLFLIECLMFFIHVDYGKIGVLLIFCYDCFRKKKDLFLLSHIILYTFLYGTYLYEGMMQNINIAELFSFYIPYYLCSIISILLLLSYNGKEGKQMKWFYYAFYPVHLIVIYFIFHNMI